MKNKPIGIFDSGVGGLTVVAELIKKLPSENLTYFGDTARFPYGNKTKEQLIKYTFQIVNFLQKQDVKLVVIACNSASSAALEKAQKEFDIPIVGVVKPGAQAAVMNSLNRHIGVIGTEATIQSNAYKKAIHLFDAGAQVFSASCPDFASFVENGYTEGNHIKEIAHTYLNPLKKKDIDTLILGCTHYPLLSKIIQKVMGENVRLVNSAEETAAKVKEILARKNRLRIAKKTKHRFICTGESSKFHKLSTRFLGKSIKNIELLELPPLAKKA